jgi:hypothetical protein
MSTLGCNLEWCLGPVIQRMNVGIVLEQQLCKRARKRATRATRKWGDKGRMKMGRRGLRKDEAMRATRKQGDEGPAKVQDGAFTAGIMMCAVWGLWVFSKGRYVF